MKREPDFENLRRTLYCQKGNSVPLIELFHDIEVMDTYMDKEVNTIKDQIEFYYKAGYDYFPMSMKFMQARSPEEEKALRKERRESRKNRITYSTSESKKEIISNLNDFREYDWRNHSWLKGGGDLSYLEYADSMLPKGMKIIAWTDGIYEFFQNQLVMKNSAMHFMMISSLSKLFLMKLDKGR